MRRSSSIAGSSSRQSMMALRVEDSNKMGLQTPQMKDRSTLGKLSMSKPTSGASEGKASCSGNRASGAGGSRSSQHGVFGTEKIKDPRPLHDKTFIQQCIKKLYEFLLENAYGHNVSMKSLQSPSVKDFLKIFTFIYRFLCPSYELPDSKFEEEIPKVFKDLGVTLRKVKTSLEGDVQKYQAYLASLESHVAVLDQKLESVNSEVETAEMEVEAMKQENARLRHVLDNQKYSAVDIERVNHERNELQQTINKLTKELEAEEHLLWNEELKYARNKEAIDKQLAEYHKLARKLKLIPVSAKNSKGHDFEIQFNPDEGPNCLLKYGTQIKVPLMEIINETEEEIIKATQRKMTLEDTLEQVNIELADKKRSVKMLTEEAEKLDDLYQQKLKEIEEEEQKCANVRESLEKHKQLLESGVYDGLSEATNELHDLQRQYQVVLQTTTEEKRKIGANLNHLIETVATHIASIVKYLDEQNVKIHRDYEEFMSEDLLSNLTSILDSYKKKAESL
ncbi:PREDICTED: kinetochore protein NDC80 homolog [Pseudopodoces humilis]|uniref:kinetochore protein NDC80 homolog n=1 Tax=Pseudopodoces humilis TaxID=181119 RepID=UPI0006B6CFEF|nr:PREDICTED: kinetochore protein NDC80 homolog [Pseudopodoces humilis]